jgi:hypothetical protein
MSEIEVRTKMEQAMTAIEEFYFGDEEDAGETMFNNFAKVHAHHFAGYSSVYQDEHKLEHTAAYQQFQTLFENKLEEIVSQHDISVSVFFE